MNFSEIEFLAEDEIVEIIPNFSTKKPIELFAGSIGPLEAGLTTKVPLWAAAFLKQRHRCKIIPPEWMNIDSLENLKIKETEDRFLIPLPSVHMFEISQLILQHASNDVPNGDKIKTLLRDIIDIR
uniref:GINS complex subunit 2 n=1 Tax=Romanomermis culicivorax TaxID=13658 RepID=A0A915ID49_ROMCU